MVSGRNGCQRDTGCLGDVHLNLVGLDCVAVAQDYDRGTLPDSISAGRPYPAAVPWGAVEPQ